MMGDPKTPRPGYDPDFTEAVSGSIEERECQGCEHWVPHWDTDTWYGHCKKVTTGVEEPGIGAYMEGAGRMITHPTFHCASWEMNL